MHIEKKGIKTMEKLTPKQEKFCELIAKGETQNKAYKQVYGCKGSNNNTIYNNAYKLINQDNIRERIAELKTIAEQDIKYTKEQSFKKLCDIQEQAYKENNISAVIRAEELKGKLFDLYNTKADINLKADINHTFEPFKIVYSIDGELLRKLIQGEHNDSNVKMILDDLKRTDTAIITQERLQEMKNKGINNNAIEFSARLKEPDTYSVVEMDIDDRNC